MLPVIIRWVLAWQNIRKYSDYCIHQCNLNITWHEILHGICFSLLDSRKKMAATFMETMLSIWLEILTFFPLSFRLETFFYSFFRAIKLQKGNKWLVGQEKVKTLSSECVCGEGEEGWNKMPASSSLMLPIYMLLVVLYESTSSFCVCLFEITARWWQMTSFKSNF